MKNIFLYLFFVIIAAQVANGSTIASRQYNFGDDKANGIPITAARVDGELNYDIIKLNQKVIIAASAPSSPIAGMFWYDSLNSFLKEYRNSEWVIHAPVHVGTSSPATNQTGDVWYDSTNKLLKAYNGSGYVTIGPVDFSAPSIGIGTITPVAGKFTTLQSTSTAFLQGNVGIGTITATGGALMIQGGNVGIGTVNANQKLTVVGKIYSTSGGIQFPDNTTQSTAAPAGAYTAGAYLIAGPSDIIQGGNTGAFTKVIELTIPRSGALRITFGLMGRSASTTDARIYRNGSAVGTTRSISGSTWTEFTEDISGWASGDLLQIYAFNSGGSDGFIAGALRLYENTPIREYFTLGGVNLGVTALMYTGPITPPGALGNIGDLYTNTSGGVSTTLYVKTGASTWTAK